MIFNRATIIKLTLFVILLSNLVLKSQTIVTIGSNTTTVNSERYPFNGYYNYNWASQIYLNSEVGGSGTLTAVSFSVTNSPSNYTMTAQKIYVRQTTASSYTSSTYPTITGFTLVFDGTIIYNGNGWKTITFTTPFVYNANSNLEFLFENRDGSFASGFPYFAYTTTTGANRLKRDYRDASFPTTCAACSALNNIINIRITKNCSSNPSISISANSTSVCVGNSVTIVASGADTYTWNPTTGLNTSSSASVQASPIGNTTYTVTGTLGGCIGSNTTTVNVIPVNAGVAIATGATNTCQNQNVNLSIQNQIANPLHTFVIWQSSLDNIAYTDISGATSQLYSTAVNTSTYFRAKFSNGTCIGYSTPVYYATSNNYYVNDNSITGDIYTMAIGSSSNNGKSKLSPKASVNDIITSYNLGPCDTIFVDSGSYIEEINFAGLDNGSSQGYITLIGAGIDKSVYTAPLSKNNILLNASRYININNFTFNSTQSLYYNINVQSSERNLISSNKFNHSTSSNIYFFGSVNKSNLNRVISNTISNGSNFGSGVYIEGNADSIMVSNNDITMTHASSISGIYVTSYYTSSANYYPAHGSVSQNTITAPNYGIKLYGSSYPISTYTINNNIINIQTKAPTEGACIWLGTVGTSNNDKTIIYNNRLNGGTNGIYLSTNADYIKVYNNYISGSDNGLNVSASNSEIGEVYFNSFYNSLNNLYFSFSSAAYWKVKNNILYNTNASASNACVSIGNSGVTFSAYNYNAYYAPNGASIGRISTTNYTTLAAWRGVDHSDETPKGDENSIVGNPLYINVSQNNLDLPTNTPFSSSGISINGISTDINGISRAVVPSIGAYESLISVSAGNTQTITCSIPTVTLSGTVSGSGLTYAWTGPSVGILAGTTPNALSTQVSAVGIYTLTASNSNSSTTSTVAVVSNTTLPNVNAGLNQVISSTNTIVTLSGSSSTSSVSFSWSPGGSSPQSATTSVTSSAVYTLTVTDLNNGCKNADTVFVIGKLSATASIIDYENDTLMGSVTLNINGGVPPYKISMNGVKQQSSSEIIKQLNENSRNIVVDTILFKQLIDSVYNTNTFKGLNSNNYSFTVYDNANDSVKIVCNVGVNLNDFLLLRGLHLTNNEISPTTINNVANYSGNGIKLVQSGTFISNNHFAEPLYAIDLLQKNDISFSLDYADKDVYVALTNDTLPPQTPYSDIAKSFALKFNSNSTYEIVANNNLVYTSNYLPHDNFNIVTSNALSRIFIYKNNELAYSVGSLNVLESSSIYRLKVGLNSPQASISDLKIIKVVVQPVETFIKHAEVYPRTIPIRELLPIEERITPSALFSRISSEIIGASCEIECSGEIKLNVERLSHTALLGQFTISPSAPSKGFVENGDFSFTNLCPNQTYTVTYKNDVWYWDFESDFIGGRRVFMPLTTTFTFNTLYNPNWTDLVNVFTHPSESLIKFSGNNNTGTATTLNKLPASQNGYIEFQFKPFSRIGNQQCQLGYTDENNSSSINIEYPITIFHNLVGFNIILYDKNGDTHYAILEEKDKIRFEKSNNGTLSIKINNVLLDSWNIQNKNLKVAAHLFTEEMGIKNIKVNFGCGFAYSLNTSPYLLLKKKLDAGFYQCSNFNLLFAFEEEYFDAAQNPNLNYQILNEMGSPQPLASLTKNIGYNLFNLNVQSLHSNELYTLIVTNKKGEVWKARFKK